MKVFTIDAFLQFMAIQGWQKTDQSTSGRLMVNPMLAFLWETRSGFGDGKTNLNGTESLKSE